MRKKMNMLIITLLLAMFVMACGSEETVEPSTSEHSEGEIVVGIVSFFIARD